MTQLRLPPATTLGTVRLQVSELERSIDYYERVIGLVAVKQGARRADLTTAGGAMTIVELCERRFASPVPKRGRWGSTILRFCSRTGPRSVVYSATWLSPAREPECPIIS